MSSLFEELDSHNCVQVGEDMYKLIVPDAFLQTLCDYIGKLEARVKALENSQNTKTAANEMGE